MPIIDREVMTALYRIRRTASRTRWIALSTVLASIGLMSVWVSIPSWLNVALAVVSFALLFLEVRAYRRSLASTVFVERVSDSFSVVRQGLQGNNRFVVRTFPQGCFVSDELLNQRIQEGLEAHLSATSYKIPPSLSALSQRFIDEKTKSKHVFNGHILGWDSNVGRGSSDLPQSVELQPARYFEHLGTDQLAMHDVMQNDRYLEDHGRRLIFGRHGMLRDLGESWLVNVVGTSTLAFTSDGKLIIIDQGVYNLNSEGLLAPSGSGALEPTDFKDSNSMTVAQLAANGANRELSEEAGIRPDEIAESHFLGFGRWLDKAGRPELFTLTLLSVDSHDVEKRQTGKLEKHFVRGRLFTRLVGAPYEWASENPELMLEPDFRGRLSLPLSAGLSLLTDFVARGSAGATQFQAQVIDSA